MEVRQVPRVREHSTTPLRIFQLNTQGAMVVLHELNSLLREERVDLALVQEPYSGSCSTLVGVGLAVHKAVSQGCGDPRAAVLAYNGRTNVTELDHLSNRHMVCILLRNISLFPIFGRNLETLRASCSSLA